jgi:Domain of unknown function (DUF4388)
MRGTLSKKFSVEPLVQVLGNHRSTGKLIVMHPIRGRFAAYLENGRLVHAEYGSETGVDALATLIYDQRGDFEFFSDEKTTQKTIKGMLEFALITAMNLSRKRTGFLSEVKIKARGTSKVLEPEFGRAGGPVPVKTEPENS